MSKVLYLDDLGCSGTFWDQAPCEGNKIEDSLSLEATRIGQNSGSSQNRDARNNGHVIEGAKVKVKFDNTGKNDGVSYKGFLIRSPHDSSQNWFSYIPIDHTGDYPILILKYVQISGAHHHKRNHLARIKELTNTAIKTLPTGLVAITP